MGCVGLKRKKETIVLPTPRNNTLSKQKTTKALTKIESVSDHYTLQQTIAHLPYGKIVKSIHKQSQLIRSIKILNIKLNDSFVINERHLRIEVKTLSKLDHPNILRVFDILHDDLKLYIIMEYWTGGLLLDKIKENGYLTEKISGNIIHQILSGVKYCHDNKVIHRDLNPKKIFMMNNDNTPSVKIGEFGSSVFIDPELKFEGKFDSWVYVAPEVADDNYNEKCDLWSVGVIMYVVLTGRTPFIENCEQFCDENSKKAELNLEVLKSLKISNQAIDLIQKLLCVDYLQRISAEEALKHPWFKLLKSNDPTIERNLDSALVSLKNYSHSSKLIDSIQEFIAKQIVTHKESKDIIEVFKTLDSD